MPLQVADAIPGHRYEIHCRRQRSSNVTFFGRFIGTEGDEALFELDDVVGLRVDDWALLDLEPA